LWFYSASLEKRWNSGLNLATAAPYVGVGQNNGNATDLYAFFINMLLDRFFPLIEPQSFLVWTGTSFEQSLAKSYFFLKNIFELP
jgi:hypothetical protein